MTFFVIFRDEALLDAQEKSLTEAYRNNFGLGDAELNDQEALYLQGCLRFSRKFWDTIANENPNFGIQDLADVFVSTWTQLAREEQQEIVLEYQLETAEAAFQAEGDLGKAIKDGEGLIEQMKQ